MNAELESGAPTVDLVIRDGFITAVRPHRSGGTRAPSGVEVIDAAGRAVIPGLHDHHVHLRAWAAALESIEVGPPRVRSRSGLAEALDRPGSGWIRAVGYHDSVAGPLDRMVLDRMTGSRPVRIQHRSGALWILNSSALSALPGPLPDHPGVERDAAGRPTGRLFRMDAWLGEQLPPAPLDLREVASRGLRAGVTGFTEAGADLSPATSAWLADEVRSGRLPQRLVVMSPRPGPPGSEQRLHPAGTRRGPVKFLLDDVALPPLDELARQLHTCHRAGLAVAIHCVTRAQLFLTLAALSEAGAMPGDRIEHGSVIPEEALSALVRLGVAVVTNPAFLHQRGDQYLVEVEASDLAHLYRARSLLRAGIPLAAGTDAPFGPSDPWTAIRTSVERRGAAGVVLGGPECLDPAEALALFLCHPESLDRRRRLSEGAAADLCVLAAPLVGVLGSLGSLETDGPPPVTATVIGGRIAFRAE